MGKSDDLRAWISEAVGLAGHTDGAIHSAVDDAMATGMQQGPRPEQQDCAAALLWIPRGGVLSPHCAAVIADGMGDTVCCTVRCRRNTLSRLRRGPPGG